MLIAIVEFEVAKENRPAAVAQLLAEAASVRTMTGNISFCTYADPSNETSVLILHRWNSKEDFQNYVSSDAFRRSGEILRPMMTTAPQSQRYEARLIESVA
ncbi:MAG: antibiotic biosynthesis monooxygenase family protein [Aestuariivirga sp.]